MNVKSGTKQTNTTGEQSTGILPWMEKAFQELTEHISDGVYRLNTDGYFTLVNKVITDRAGITREIFYTLHFLDIVDPQYHDLANRNFQRVMGGEDGIPYELKYKDGNGQVRFVEVRSRPIREGKRVVGLLGISRDVTDRTRTEEALKKSERNFRRIFDQSPIAAAIVSIDGHFTRVNKAMCRMLGYTEEEFGSLRYGDITHPDHLDTDREEVKRLISGEIEEYITEKKYLRKDGNILWGQLSLRAIRDLSGHFLYSLPMIVDITERKQAEEALRNSEEKYHAVLENASDAILLADEHGNIVEVNKKAEEVLGYGREELLQMNYTQLHPMMELGRTIDAFKKIVKQGHGTLQDGSICRKDAKVIPVDITGSVIQCAGMKVIQGSFRDISEQKRAKDALERLVSKRTAELSEKNEQLIMEIREHKRDKAALRKKTNELQLHSNKLKELNAALKVLLKQREEDRTELEEKVLTNVKNLLLPQLEMLKKLKFDPKSKMHLDILESNLKNIISSFPQRLSSKQSGLTTREVQVADLIRQGKSTKEIARFLEISTSAVSVHRYHIRVKLGIIEQKINLRTHLQTLS